MVIKIIQRGTWFVVKEEMKHAPWSMEREGKIVGSDVHRGDADGIDKGKGSCVGVFKRKREKRGLEGIWRVGKRGRFVSFGSRHGPSERLDSSRWYGTSILGERRGSVGKRR
jgi:hypothetical protein